jgi:hypothetical protein
MVATLEGWQPTMTVSGMTHEEMPMPEGWDWPNKCPECESPMFYQVDTLGLSDRFRAYCYFSGHRFTFDASDQPNVVLTKAEEG